MSPPSEFEPEFCPFCGESLESRLKEGRERLFCDGCRRFIWRNPAPVAAVIVTDGEEVLMVERGIEPGKGEWSVPAGFLEYEESPAEGAARELEEETGIEADETDLEFVDSMNFERFSGQRLIANVYKVERSRVSGEVSPGDDAADAKFCDPEKLVEMGEELREQYLDQIENVLERKIGKKS